MVNDIIHKKKMTKATPKKYKPNFLFNVQI